MIYRPRVFSTIAVCRFATRKHHQSFRESVRYIDKKAFARAKSFALSSGARGKGKVLQPDNLNFLTKNLKYCTHNQCISGVREVEKKKNTRVEEIVGKKIGS